MVASTLDVEGQMAEGLLRIGDRELALDISDRCDIMDDRLGRDNYILSVEPTNNIGKQNEIIKVSFFNFDVGNNGRTVELELATLRDIFEGRHYKLVSGKLNSQTGDIAYFQHK